MLKQTIQINTGIRQSNPYAALLGVELNQFTEWLPQNSFSKIIIITDDQVKHYYGYDLQNRLIAAGFSVLLISFAAGESAKNYQTKQMIEAEMHVHYCDRESLILALGGGVVGDMAGFIAATFLRGVRYIHIPTTLLAMLDSSIGGKTGINTIYGKNLIGCFYHPINIVMDLTTLKTLPDTQLLNGLFEAIKMFLTHDAQGLNFVINHLQQILQNDEAALSEVVKRAVCIKAGVIARDEQEQSERSLLNFGHTIGHALEKASAYQVPHGYAIAYGILVEATLSRFLNLISAEDLFCIKTLLARLGIHGHVLNQYSPEHIIQLTKHDKKSRLAQTHYVLLSKLGQAYVQDHHYTHPVGDQLVKEALQLVSEEAYGR